MKKNQSDEIVKLTDTQHHRLRTEMYLGSRNLHTQTIINWDGSRLVAEETTWTPAVYCAFREILDNALDEVIGHNHGSKIDVEYNPSKLYFSVSDDGRGIPIDYDDTEKMHKATLALTQARAGRNFGTREEVRGTNGIGASVVVSCSESFTIDIIRDGKRFVQTFSEGTDIFPDLNVGRPKITSNNGRRGTTATFTLSQTVFPNATVPLKFIEARIFEIAANHPKIKFTLNGQKVEVKKNLEKTFFDNQPIIKIDVISGNFKSFYYLLPNFQPDGEYIHSTVNDIPAFNGGQHIDIFKRLFFGGLLKALEKESKRRNLVPNRSDIAEGLLIYNTTSMHAPNFDSQSKTRLINDEVSKFITDTLSDEDLFKSIIKQNKEWVESIFKKCAERTQKKDNAELAKLSRKLLRNKIPKLLDANGRDRSKCILFLCEGDSASTMISAVRDPEIHGSLPLRGKILNVRGESNKTIIENQIITDLMAAIGVSLGQKVNRSELRYGKIYLAADQDPDGANITALLVNFFYLHWPELFDKSQEPVFYAFQTPFIIQEKGKKRYYWYSDDYHKYTPSDWKGCPKPTRAKGLGSLEETDWIHSLSNPKLVPIIDDGNLGEALDLIFNGDRADDRKAWIALS
jgi:DNA gyrase/topoisomerase IV subunit B